MKLERSYIPDIGVLGQLHLKNGVTLYTVERPWAHNKPFHSCIPEGNYKLVDHLSPRFGATYALVNENLNVFQYKKEEGRYAILLHPANWPHEVEGCIAPGMKLSRNKIGVISSVVAMNDLKAYLRSHPEDRQIQVTTYKPGDV